MGDEKSNSEVLVAFPKATEIMSPSNGSLFNGKKKINTLPQEIEVYEARERGEIVLASDELDYLTRQVLIGASAFGSHQVNKIAIFSGATLSQVQDIVNKNKSKLEKETYCLTKPEIMARLSILATNGNDGTKLAALKMLMEFRGVATPEGGSRNFKRTVMKFATGQ